MAHPGELEHRGVPQPRPIPSHHGPVECRLRPARSDDMPRIAALLDAHSQDLVERVEQLLRSEMAARLLHRGNGNKQVLADLAQALLYDRLPQAYAGLSTVLVAEHDPGDLVGALIAAPPVNEINTWIEAAEDPHRVLIAALTIAQIDALVLDTAAPAGTDEKLLTTCVELYRLNDYAILYGHANATTPLPPAYHAAGFTLLKPGQTMTLEPLLDLPLLLEPKPDTRLFARWLTTNAP